MHQRISTLRLASFMIRRSRANARRCAAARGCPPRVLRTTTRIGVMPIVLALVASGSTILAEWHDDEHARFLVRGFSPHCASTWCAIAAPPQCELWRSPLVGDATADLAPAQTAASTILARIPPNASRLSYAIPNEPWMFHFIADDGLVYLNVSDTDSGRRVPFAMLTAMQKEFGARYDVREAVQSGSREATKEYAPFATWLAGLVKSYNNPSADAAASARAELQGARDVMQANIDQVLARGERLDTLVSRTDQAANQSLHFRRRAVGLRRQMWWKNARVMGMAAFCALVRLGLYTRPGALLWLTAG